MSGHTKGPWTTRKAYNGDIEITAPGCNNVIAECFAAINVHDEINPECEANAHLIAAAPDMLEALEDILEAYVTAAQLAGHRGVEKRANVIKIRATIAKAKGLS